MMLSELRAHTQSLHKEIEKENLAGLIMDHSISRNQYKTLLLQNYIAYKVVEDEVSPYMEDYKTGKSDQLKKDLDFLKVDIIRLRDFKTKFNCQNKMGALGAAYVVEGSVLGGLMIAKELSNCIQLNDIKIHHFFNGDRTNINGWKQFCKQVKNTQYSEEEINQAVEKAKETFIFFGKVFKEILAEELTLKEIL
ncbi:heme oxygenase [Gillisia sp. Hel_I_86]|uniref:biliverdin-producing heme oxygenase n=1 Tax=Gillisia sp. Hel_I_86 TaxID=1249981 RepID=UPI00119958D1|nr:biliverdin-producing heme oxygenase [Gillisia sp. Hel_I_86]TVZ27677.1 heme oxygenase [Gillisia sp. Hel_I_86]